MERTRKAFDRKYIFVGVLLALLLLLYFICNGNCRVATEKELILTLDTYADSQMGNIQDQLLHRIQVQPFNLVSFFLFFCAIVHTFFAHRFILLSKRLRRHNVMNNIHPVDSFGVEVLHFMGEVEVVFGLWVMPLFLLMAYNYDWQTAIHYIDGINYTEPLFVVVIMVLASSRPILKLAEDCLKLFARLGGETVSAWWWVLLTLGPLSGSFITEPGAMTISALLLAKQFYELGPRRPFAYATLGLLFANISVGGVLTNFAAPPVLMVSRSWNWDTPYMLKNFGLKAIVGIFLANLLYYFIFRQDFIALEEKRVAQKVGEKKEREQREKVPFWISLVHVLFLVWIVHHNHYPVIFIGAFLLFLGFYQATLHYQDVLDVKPAILVGFFLGGLVIHGSLQGWWIEPILGRTSVEALYVVSAFLTSFNDNAAITFLATLIPSFDEAMKYAVVAGAVTGGGLTVIANAPNPSGQSILSKYFEDGVSALGLLSGAILPTIVLGLCFFLIRGFW